MLECVHTWTCCGAHVLTREISFYGWYKPREVTRRVSRKRADLSTAVFYTLLFIPSKRETRYCLDSGAPVPSDDPAGQRGQDRRRNRITRGPISSVSSRFHRFRIFFSRLSLPNCLLNCIIVTTTLFLLILLSISKLLAVSMSVT